MIINPLQSPSMGKNTNNKVNRWSLELTTYNITFQWISGAKTKVADCLSWFVELPTTTPAAVNMLRVTHTDGPASNTRSHTKRTLLILPTHHTQMFHLAFLLDTTQIPKPLTADRLEALLQMQRTDPFCRHISKCLFNGKALQHETDVFTHVKGLLYKHVMDSGKQFLALVIPKSWNYMVLVEAHDKLGHQGSSCTYCLIKRQYYWKSMDEDIRK